MNELENLLGYEDYLGEGEDFSDDYDGDLLESDLDDFVYSDG